MRANLIPAISILAAVSLAGLVALASEASESRIDRTRTELHTLQDAVELYRVKTGAYPNELSELVAHWERPLLVDLPNDPWGHPYVWLRPAKDAPHGCLLSKGADGLTGTPDDVRLECPLPMLNQQVLIEAGLKGELDRLDVYGRRIRFIHTSGALMAWSYGQDGRPDTEDDQVARIALSALRKN